MRGSKQQQKKLHRSSRNNQDRCSNTGGERASARFDFETMEGDLDETVQRCASLLTSDDGIGSACSLLMGLWREGSSDEKRMIFARLAQEVAASHGGTVLRHLLWRTLGQPYLPLDSQGQQNFLASVHCNLSLGMLTSSKVVVERCLREGLGLKDLWESGVGPKENGSGMRQGKTLDSGRGPKEEETGRVPEERETARQIYARLMLHIAHFSAIVRLSGELSIRPAVNNLVTLVVAGSLECLSNFARASKAFRDAIRDAAEEQNMFERFGDLLRPEHLTKIVPHTALEIRLSLASLAVSLAHSADSQLWAIDRGL